VINYYIHPENKAFLGVLVVGIVYALGSVKLDFFR